MSMIDIPFIDMAIPSTDCGRTPEECEKVKGVQDQLEALKQQLKEARAQIACVATQLSANNKATDELLEIIQMGKGFFRAVGWIGKWLRRIVMWVVPPVAAVIGLWQLIRPPKT